MHAYSMFVKIPSCMFIRDTRVMSNDRQSFEIYVPDSGILHLRIIAKE